MGPGTATRLLLTKQKTLEELGNRLQEAKERVEATRKSYLSMLRDERRREAQAVRRLKVTVDRFLSEEVSLWARP